MKIKRAKSNRGFIDVGIYAGLVFLASLVVVSAGIGTWYLIENPPAASAPDGWYMMGQK